MTKADRPASRRKVIHGGAQLPAYSFDPLMVEAYQCCNKEWVKLCYVPGVTNADLDDDKINQTSPQWKLYGMQTHPTKDKKQKPVIHTTASIGSGMILILKPEFIGMKLSDMLREVIKELAPSDQPAMRKLLGFFIDRGYLEIAKVQTGLMTNLIQVIEDLSASFLGTIKIIHAFHSSSLRLILMANVW
jgi:hypothetical protein